MALLWYSPNAVVAVNFVATFMTSFIPSRGLFARWSCWGTHNIRLVSRIAAIARRIPRKC
jgi:hypothetical protein